MKYNGEMQQKYIKYPKFGLKKGQSRMEMLNSILHRSWVKEY